MTISATASNGRDDQEEGDMTTAEHFESRIAELHAADERNKVIESGAIALARDDGSICYRTGVDTPEHENARNGYRAKARLVLEAAGYDQVREDRDFHAKRCLAVEKVLDRALGTDAEAGTGEGIAADVALVVQHRDEVRAKLAELAHTHRRRDINGQSYCADHDGHNRWVPYPCATRLTVDGASAS